MKRKVTVTYEGEEGKTVVGTASVDTETLMEIVDIIDDAEDGDWDFG